MVTPRLVVLGPALTVTAGSHMNVEAGELIKLLPGFRVENSARFQARINATLRPRDLETLSQGKRLERPEAGG